MATDLEKQADALGDEGAYERPGVRSHLRHAALCMHQAFAELEGITDDELTVKRNRAYLDDLREAKRKER